MKFLFTIIFVLTVTLAVFSQDEYIPIVHKKGLVGGIQNGKWLKDTEIQPHIRKPTEFLGFDSFKYDKPTKIYGTISEIWGCGTYSFFFGESATTPVPEDNWDKSGLNPNLAIGANAKWNPVPRIPQSLDKNNKDYKKIALDFLKTKGISTKQIKLEGVYTVDLEGDGTKEVFIEATTYFDGENITRSTAKAKDYSFVLMQKIINGKTQNILIDGEFYPKLPEQEDYLSEFNLSAVADLNGDGKMEIVIEGFYSYGGMSTEIYDISGDKLITALEVECGD